MGCSWMPTEPTICTTSVRFVFSITVSRRLTKTTDNPTANTAGDQHWGHATSRDLYHWINQPIAIFPPTNDTQVFTGSAVVDVNNTSGFFPDQDNGVVAIYTLNTPTGQVQDISYSVDGGYTFTAFSGNPVLTSTSTQFRDPKVIWFEDHWVMIVSFAADLTLGFYTSPDLKTWSSASNFTYPGSVDQFECPNIVNMPVQGSNDSTYVLSTSISSGGPAGGGAIIYFPGTFNGTHFTAVDDTPRFVDFGADSYAGQFFSGIPDDDDALFIAWATNGQYSQDTPTAQEGWRSTMSLPRRNRLAPNATSGSYDLITVPQDLSPVLGEQLASSTSLVNSSLVVDYSAVASNAMYFEVNATGVSGASSAATLNFTISSPISGESVRGAYSFGGNNTFVIDRSGVRGFNNTAFTGTPFTTTSAVRADGTWTLAGVVDRSILEVFVDRGVASATALFFATQPLTVFTFSTAQLPANASVSVAVYAVESAWKAEENGEGVVVGNVTTIAARDEL